MLPMASYQHHKATYKGSHVLLPRYSKTPPVQLKIPDKYVHISPDPL